MKAKAVATPAASETPAGARSDVFDDLGVVLDMRPGDENRESVRPCLKPPRGPRTNAHDVEQRQLNDVTIELETPAALEDDQDFLSLVVAMRERLALPRFQAQVGSPVCSAPRSRRGKRASWTSEKPPLIAASSMSSKLTFV